MTITNGSILQRDRFQARLDANALELFARVNEAGSFAAAGRQLGVTRAAISSRIAAIETQIERPLFVRHSRALCLTETGRGLIAQAKAVLAATDAARRNLRTCSEPKGLSTLQGSLRISSCPSYGHGVLATRLTAFQALNPNLRIEVQFSNRPVDLVRENFDVAFRMTSSPPEECVATPVLRFAIRAWATPARFPALAEPASLAQQPCLIWGASTEPLNITWENRRGRRCEMVSVSPAICVDDLRTLVDLAVAGRGIVFAPTFAVAAYLESEELHDVLPDWDAKVNLGDSVVALTLAHAFVPDAARALVNFVREPAPIEASDFSHFSLSD